MSSCCEDNKEKTKAKEASEKNRGEKPESVIGKYLYKIGKKEAEKEAKKSDGGCC